VATRATAPAVQQPGAFEGVAELSPSQANDIEPPDPWVAVGPDHVVQAVNQVIRITDRKGGSSVDYSMLSFFGLDDPDLPPTFDADPRVVYDSVHRRWLASEVAWDCTPTGVPGIPDATFGHGYLDLAVSLTEDPTGAWQPYTVVYQDAFPDFPSLGTSTDKIGQGATVFGMHADSGADCVEEDGWLGRDVAVYDWADVLANPDDMSVFLDPATDAASPRIALQTPATSKTLFAVEEIVATGDVRYLTYTGTNGGTGIVNTLSSNLASLIAPFSTPPQPRQPGSVIGAAVDERPTDAIWKGNRLSFVSTYPCDLDSDSTADDCVRVTQLSTPSSAGSAPTRAQDFLVGDAGKDSFMGGIGLSQDGTLHVVWTSSSGSAQPATVSGYQRSGAAANTLSSTATLKSSAAAYTGSRWGDYVGVAQDPQVPDAVWQANQYVAADGSWATRISRLQTGGLRYVPVTPTRIVDTRYAINLPAKLRANVPQTFAVTGKATIPTTARAITANVTVVNQTAKGYVAITPEPTASPPSSTLNFPVGDIRANNLTAALGSGGKLSAVFRATGGTVDLIVDVTGYYLDDAAQAAFNPIAPVRMLDTRQDVGLTGPLVGATPRRLEIGGVSIGGSVAVPNTAVAVTGNLTVVNQSRSGFLAITSTSQSNPATSSLNFPLNDVRANGVTVPLDTNATHRGFWLVYRGKGTTTGATTDVVFDVTGYFTKGSGGLTFHALNPGRIMDTRPGVVLTGLTGAFESKNPRALAVAGHWGVSAAAKAITANVTVVDQTFKGYVAVTRDLPASIPSTSTINFPVGDIRANGVTTALSQSGSPTGSASFDYVSTRDGTTAEVILDLSGYFE
jgi:hypothetical protein